ncbi:MAG: ECF transporter S component [Acutalibacter sp.]|nr:ECF transporter S component [Acutalibacter sp.]
MQNVKEKISRNGGSLKRGRVRKLAVTAVLGAVSAALMFVAFRVPLMPSFIQLDLSELPALIAAFSLGPVSGVAVCLIKNLVHLLVTTTGGVGELSNFLLGAAFVLPAGLVYRFRKDRVGALLGSLAGAALMALASLPSNYFITYPFYAMLMPMEAILDMYRAINPNVQTLMDALVWFNIPFTFVKAMLSVGVTFLIYKRISPVLKGKS